jgi:hypothetical protein
MAADEVHSLQSGKTHEILPCNMHSSQFNREIMMQKSNLDEALNIKLLFDVIGCVINDGKHQYMRDIQVQNEV